MSIDVNDGVQTFILRNGAYEPETVDAVRGMLQKDHVFVDVGAHVGQFSLLASRLVGSEGRVISVEPNPLNFLDLQTNLELNDAKNVSTVLAAVFDQPAVLRFEKPPASNRGASRLASEASADGYSVGAFPLGEILRSLEVRSIDTLKIDVEGAEYQVMKSVFEGACPRPRNLIFEFLPDYFSYAIGATNFLAYIEEQGYALHTVRGEPYQIGNTLPEHNVWGQSTLAR